jgi:hypothetical protein
MRAGRLTAGLEEAAAATAAAVEAADREAMGQGKEGTTLLSGWLMPVRIS